MSTSADLMGLGMPPALADRLGNTPASVAGAGTSQSGAGLIATPVVLGTPTASNTAFMLSNKLSTGRPVYFWNQSATVSALIFPPSGGTINGGASNASVSVPPLSGAILQLENGAGVAAESWGAVIGIGSVNGLLIQSATDSITAHAGGGQTSATQLTAQFNHVTVVASAADSVKLPPSVVGMQIEMTNSSANSMQAFGTSPDTINGAATGTGVAVAAGKTAIFTCYTAGAWIGPVALA
jgi:hypothetical protein